jgi:peptidoglycan/xylan/chitin deacetylase (PgdA/CDA1 family)
MLKNTYITPLRILFIAIFLFWLINFLLSPVEVVIYVDDVSASYPIEELKEINAIIDKHDAKAIYFIIPDHKNASFSPEFVEELKNRELGLHGWRHERGEFDTNYKDAYEMIKEGRIKLEGHNLKPTYFKPPWNEISKEAERAVLQNNLSLINLSFDREYCWYKENIHPWYELGMIDLYLDKRLEITIHVHAINQGKGLEILDKLLNKADSLK